MPNIFIQNKGGHKIMIYKKTTFKKCCASVDEILSKLRLTPFCKFHTAYNNNQNAHSTNNSNSLAKMNFISIYTIFGVLKIRICIIGIFFCTEIMLIV